MSLVCWMMRDWMARSWAGTRRFRKFGRQGGWRLRLRRRRCFLRRGGGRLWGWLDQRIGLDWVKLHISGAEESTYLRGRSAGRRIVDRESSAFVRRGGCSIASGTRCVQNVHGYSQRGRDIGFRSARYAHLALRRSFLRWNKWSRCMDGGLCLSRRVRFGRRGRRCRFVLVSRRAV